MQELVIVSGKGGTGKTSISAALALLSPSKVIADCDVDAANFHLLSDASIQETHEFKAGFEPYIHRELCTQCGQCDTLCQFQAIVNGMVDFLSCEGCGVCAFHCPAHAISMRERPAGYWFVSSTRFGPLVHAALGVSVENSGKLVNKVRQAAQIIAKNRNIPLIVIDGPPGIGCPAIAALSGASLVLAVVEPSVSGIHDLSRLADLLTHFQLPMLICINKCTLHKEGVDQILTFCRTKGLPVIAQIPYSPSFPQAIKMGKTVLELPDVEEDVRNSLTQLWRNLAKYMNLPVARGHTSWLQRWFT